LAKDRAYQVGPDIVVSLSCEVFDADGELVVSSDGTRDVVIGYGELLPVVEAAILGLTPGKELKLELPPDKAYGKRDPKAVIEVDRSEFPDDVAPGDRFEAEGESGESVVLQVLDVLDDAVVVDRNHPLAGLTLTVALRIVGTRPATADELATAAEALLLRQAEDRPPELIPPDRLLKGGSRS
jgi:FKBP-type peptidyl-prolyl cis-trans isomerase SlyD